MSAFEKRLRELTEKYSLQAATGEDTPMREHARAVAEYANEFLQECLHAEADEGGNVGVVAQDKNTRRLVLRCPRCEGLAWCADEWVRP